MTKKKKGLAVKVRYEKCELFSTFEMVCPLCNVTVPPNTVHECRKESK